MTDNSIPTNHSAKAPFNPVQSKTKNPNVGIAEIKALPIEQSSPPPPTVPTIEYQEDRSNYDRSNPAFPILQAPKEAMATLPLDAFGAVDWVTALSSKKINPRTTLLDHIPMSIRDTKIIMKDTQAMPYVTFPHLPHTKWLDCSNCHPHPFKKVAGSSDITMDSIMRGQHCGMCHDRVAFSIFACERCHNLTHPGSPKRWW